MKKLLLFTISIASFSLFAQQRFTSEVFSSVNVSSDITYATNIDFLTSDFSDQVQVGMDVTDIWTNILTGMPIPTKYYDPTDTTTDVKVTDIKYDLYEPVGDTMTNRPLVVYIHTGNFLPPQINGSINGTKTDSSCISMCEKLAKRGFVAISADYRLGWNPLLQSVAERRGQLLNAVYRAIHDMKELVRIIKADATNMGIDPNKITFMGEGSGGYVALAYATLDKWAEVEISKFLVPGTSMSYVDSTLVGNIEGIGGNLNLYVGNGQPTDINMVINLGGALADESWLEAGDPAMIAFQCVRDPYAPYHEGTVIVPTTGDDVVDVHGANVFIPKANNLGNNNAFTSQTYNDPITMAARAKYGVTYPYIYPAPFDTITVASNAEGLFPVLQPLGASLFENNGSPWQWWDPNGPIASQTEPTTGLTYHQLGLASNPNMSPAFGRGYQDTILGYAAPRMYYQLGLMNESEFDLNDNLVQLYPNPVNNELNIYITGNDLELVDYQVYDMTGRLVLNGTLESNTTINTESLKTGAYTIKLNTSIGLSTKLFTKQ